MAIYGNQLTSHAYVWSQISEKQLNIYEEYFVSY